MQIHFVLVEPARAENVGAAARAMKTMGFDSLRLVNSELHRAEQSHWVAHGSQEILHQARSFASLPEALVDMDLVVATTARERGRFHYQLDPQQLKQQLADKGSSHHQVALLFGREESGLSNEEIALADLICYLPLAVSYPSLNLAQAVMLFAYELSRSRLEEQGPAGEAVTPAGAGQVRHLKQRLSRMLLALGVKPEENLFLWLNQRIPMLPQRDVSMLHSLSQYLEKRLNGNN